MFIVFSILNGSAFYQSYNLLNIFKSAGSMALMVLGLTWVIGAGEMDCSFPEVASCASMIFAWMLNQRYDPTLCLVVSLLSGVVFGLLTSLLVVRFHFHSLITTIAVSTIAGAVANIIYKGSVLSIKGLNSTWMYKFFSKARWACRWCSWWRLCCLPWRCWCRKRRASASTSTPFPKTRRP